MGSAFGREKSPREPATAPVTAPPPSASVSDHDRAVLQLKVQRDRLHRYTASIGVVIEREVAVAKELLRADKRPQALLALKRKRYQETLLERTTAQMHNLEDLVHSIQDAAVQAQVFEALKQGNAVLETLNAQTKLEDVEALMEDTRDAVAYQNQISALLGQELTSQDEDDIEQTIAEWEAEELKNNMPPVPVGDIKPVVVAEDAHAHEVAVETEEAALEQEEATAAAPAKAKEKQRQAVLLAS